MTANLLADTFEDWLLLPLWTVGLLHGKLDNTANRITATVKVQCVQLVKINWQKLKINEFL